MKILLGPNKYFQNRHIIYTLLTKIKESENKEGHKKSSRKSLLFYRLGNLNSESKMNEMSSRTLLKQSKDLTYDPAHCNSYWPNLNQIYEIFSDQMYFKFLPCIHAHSTLFKIYPMLISYGFNRLIFREKSFKTLSHH
jgi:hypothetical protein